MAWATAKRQQGLVTRRQLLALGFGRRAIQRRIASGRLHRVAQGVYSAGWVPPTRRRLWMAAVLACGHGSSSVGSGESPVGNGASTSGTPAFVCLSHRSAGALWGICAEADARVDVSVRARRESARSWIRLRVRPGLPAQGVVVRDCIPVTDPIHTLLDLASELPAAALERAVNDADKLELIDPESLRAGLDAHAGAPGVRALRGLLDRDTFVLSDSDLEVLFRPIAATAGLPLPLSKQVVSGFEVDFLWPDLGLVVETDGLRYHRTPSAQARDRIRDQAHTAAGLTTLRFTHRQVRYQPNYVREILTRTASRLRRG